MDIDKAVKLLNARAHPSSHKRCAHYIGRALEAGGAIIAKPRYAKDYGPALLSIGFRAVPKTGYLPQKGDVIVLDPPQGKIAGHIQMFNGDIWVSDFNQHAEIYPGGAYRREQVDYRIYRP
ncbi:CHAP domain-containing protein [Chitinimonas arctica]|uniref:CHAP domain-containing protein n=1 Tax=Chitinimonas arctica TaxID=2594795 RepID=A0A516SMF0_9NEIS|nr:CHAP domain-containing protein [Chitinimonas arctica]